MRFDFLRGRSITNLVLSPFYPTAFMKMPFTPVDPIL